MMTKTLQCDQLYCYLKINDHKETESHATTESWLMSL